MATADGMMPLRRSWIKSISRKSLWTMGKQNMTPSQKGSQIQLREMRDTYEYIATYVDDLLIVSEEPQKIIQGQKNKFMLKIKGDGSLEYHLGCDYKLHKDGTLVAQPTRYINKILESYKKMFPNENFINTKSPLEKNDHPELDNSELCNEELITKYMSNRSTTMHYHSGQV